MDNQETNKILDELLAGLSELVYVSDVDTYELLYLNEPGLNLFGRDAVGNGHTCYGVLQNRDEPCPFCTNGILTHDAFYEWEHTNEKTQCHYLLRDKLFIWQGRTVRLEVAFDVTQQVNERAQYRFLAEIGTLAVDCIKILDGDLSLDVSLNEALQMVGQFLNADRAYEFKIEEDVLSNTHEWCKEGIEPQIESLQGLPLEIADYWIERFGIHRAVLIPEVDELRAPRDQERDVLASQGIHSLVAVPLEVDGKLVGLLGVDNPDHEQFSIIEMPLMSLAYFVAASMKGAEDQRRLEELTWSDPLTHVRSRAAFHRDFDQGDFERIGFALIDVDRLSDVNREQGRRAGDDILCRVAKCLSDVFGDDVYRVGDDEFCAVVTQMDYTSFAELAEKAAQNLADECLHASLGPAWNEACSNTTALFDLAGDRMRSAKRGRHRAVDLGVDLASDAAVSSLLRTGGTQEAVDAGLFTIFLMPQASGSTGEIVSAEALIRYRNREQDLQALPSSFVPALEDMGEISAIDFFALSKSCETIARWQREGKPTLPLAVNFSRRTIGEDGFVQRVSSVVASYGVDPALVEIEITESAREESGALFKTVTDDLRAAGFRVSIDDFGVENANFSLFTQVSFDVLKIDKSLVWNLGVEDRTAQVIHGLVILCDDLGIETVAEGIETPEQYNALRGAGSTRAQGYHIGKPCPIDEFEQRFFA